MMEVVPFVPPRIGSQHRTLTDRIIVSCGIGRHYRERLRSTVNHCNVHCPETWKLWFDELPEGAPPHENHQYAFKITALQRAVDAGFRYIMWMDTSFQPVASIEAVWQHIEANGWYVPIQGNSRLGEWSTDEALVGYGDITRDGAMAIPLCFSGIVGLDIHNIIGMRIWNRWKSLQATFRGPHYNEPGLHEWRRVGYKWYGHCSNDPRCQGHRHDESALSFVLHRLGLVPSPAPFIGINNPNAVVGHMIPDYDIVAMNQKCLELEKLRSQYANQ